MDDNIDIKYRPELVFSGFHDDLTGIKSYYSWMSKVAIL